jgi:hypothetical protein
MDTPAPLVRIGNVIMINGDTDLQVFRGPKARGPDEVVYEFPGSIPGSFYDRRLVPVDLASLGVTLEQNPVSFGPALRGAVANLTSWVVDRVPPPPSVAIAGGEPSPAITFFPPYSFAEAVEFSRSRTPCSGSATRNHGAYVRAVAHAANEALRNRWITEEDRDGYVTEAARSARGEVTARQLGGRRPRRGSRPQRGSRSSGRVRNSRTAAPSSLVFSVASECGAPSNARTSARGMSSSRRAIPSAM